MIDRFVFNRYRQCTGTISSTNLYESSGNDKVNNQMTERYERHRQAWTHEEIQKLHMLATKGMSLKAIAKALMRSEESTKNRAKLDKLKIQKMR